MYKRQVLGFNDVPDAGDILYGTDDDKLGRQVVQERRDKIKADQLKARAKASLDDLFNQIKEGAVSYTHLLKNILFLKLNCRETKKPLSH